MMFDIPLVQVDENVEKERTAKEIQRAVEQSNFTSNIPNRFSDTRLGTFEIPFMDDVKKLSNARKSDTLLVVSGPAGTGKTTLLTALMHERAANGVGAGEYLNSYNIVPMIRASRSFGARETEYDIIQRYAKLPFVVFDELGVSEDPKIEISFFRTVFAMRYDNLLPTAVGTNLPMKDFQSFLTICDDIKRDPIFDRINSVIVFRNLLSETGSHRAK